MAALLRTRVSLLVASLLLVSACVAPTEATEPAPVAAPLEPPPVAAPAPQELLLRSLRSVTLKTQGCYWHCAVYTLTIMDDGQVSWLGRGFVRHFGREMRQIEAREVEELFRSLLAIDLDAAPRDHGDDRCAEWVFDGPRAQLELDFGDSQCDVPVDHNCIGNAVSDQLFTIEDRIEEIAGVAEWRDKLWVMCSRQPRSARYGLQASAPARERRRVIAELRTMLDDDPSAELFVHSFASLREPEGASLARGEAFVESFVAAGGERQRVQIDDVGAETARPAVDDKHVLYFELLGLQVVSHDCIEAGGLR